jgi:hypothetical protein
MRGLKTLFSDHMSEKHTLPNQSELREKKFLKKSHGKRRVKRAESGSYFDERAI